MVIGCTQPASTCINMTFGTITGRRMRICRSRALMAGITACRQRAMVIGYSQPHPSGLVMTDSAIHILRVRICRTVVLMT